MQKTLLDLKEDVLDFFFPRFCSGCERKLMRGEFFLCVSCEMHLPKSAFASYAENPIEILFKGRLPLRAGASAFYFDKHGVVQRLVHGLKYSADHDLGRWMGRQMALEFTASGRFTEIDMLMAVPLHPKKAYLRGYNQSDWLIEGMQEHWDIAAGSSLKRVIFTESQTKKGKVERWLNVKDAFACQDPEEIEGKHIALVDDVITTGATLEACGRELMRHGADSISILCFASAQ